MSFKVINIGKTLCQISLCTILLLTSCGDHKAEVNNPNDILPILEYWNLILGNGSNIGPPTNYQDDQFFYTERDESGDWVVFKTPNAGSTHGTSHNTRTELAQLKKWSPMTNAKLNATLKVMNVSATGNAKVAASYSVVVGQIHSADGHENEPLKIYYKKFPDHTKGSVFWNYEINTAGDDNSKRWDYSQAIWGYDFSVVGTEKNTAPAEPEDGITLGEEFSYNIEVKEGVMYLTFTSEGHETKTFTKNLISSDYAERSDIPKQIEELFVPIGQDGVERKNAYADEGLFFKLGCYNQTNGKDPSENKIWCSGAETHSGDIKKQYADGNYAEVWFKSANITIPDKSVSNQRYFEANDGLANKTVYPNEVIPFMDKFKILTGDGTREKDLTAFEYKDFFYTVIDGTRRWVVYKAPNSGVTSKTSSNTRTELGQKEHWIPETGGKLTGSLKVMHVSTSGDARVPASFSVVVGQIHSDEGHKNEPLKIFYKKFPSHKKGSLFWNYEINTKGDNSKRWDYSTPIWGYDMSIIGSDATSYPEEPEDGIELGEEFSYEINVYKGIMYLTFKRRGHEPKTFTKNLIKSDFVKPVDLPKQIVDLFVPLGKNGVERKTAYAGEIQFFKQGAYNQSNGKSPDENMIWYTGANIYDGDITKQYANGSYVEVWFKEATVGPGTSPAKE